MWKPDLHPRDEYGRFRLVGGSGHWDSIAGSVEAHAHARAIAEYEANQARQSLFVAKRDAGTLTAAEDAEWDRLGERATHLARHVLPKAYHMGHRPDTQGFWFDPEGRHHRTNAAGQTLPLMLVEGAVRVGDHPRGYGRSPRMSPQAGGVWHRPGEYGPGRVPILRNDYGARMTQLEPEPSPSRRHRGQRGAFGRAEQRAEQRLYAPGEGGHKEFRRQGRAVKVASPEVHGAYQHDPRNPVGRMRTVPGHRRRQQRTTWIQRINAQMEGR
jgi:hypothetical protein